MTQSSSIATAAGLVPLPTVDELAQAIRTVDGRHDLGAGVLAERLCDWLQERTSGSSRPDQADLIGYVDAVDLDMLRAHGIAMMMVKRSPAGFRPTAIYADVPKPSSPVRGKVAIDAMREQFETAAQTAGRINLSRFEAVEGVDDPLDGTYKDSALETAWQIHRVAVAGMSPASPDAEEDARETAAVISLLTKAFRRCVRDLAHAVTEVRAGPFRDSVQHRVNHYNLLLVDTRDYRRSEYADVEFANEVRDLLGVFMKDDALPELRRVLAIAADEERTADAARWRHYRDHNGAHGLQERVDADLAAIAAARSAQAQLISR